MVDIHSHILPGLDDGAKTMEVSLAMLRQAAEAGTTDIVATPHANAHYAYEPDRVRAALKELERQAAVEGIGIRLHAGCDFHLNYENLRDAAQDPARYTVNGGRYLMVELPELIPLQGMREALKKLAARGVIPIITHPERNLTLQTKPRELAGWVADGCLVQVTGQSLTGRFGMRAQKAANAFIKAGQTNFVASDAHDAVDRTTNLGPAYAHVAERYGQGEAEALFRENPGAVVRDEPCPKRKTAVRKRWLEKLGFSY